MTNAVYFLTATMYYFVATFTFFIAAGFIACGRVEESRSMDIFHRTVGGGRTVYCLTATVYYFIATITFFIAAGFIACGRVKGYAWCYEEGSDSYDQSLQSDRSLRRWSGGGCSSEKRLSKN